MSDPSHDVQFAKLYESPRETVRRGVERAGFRGDNFISVMNWLTPGKDPSPHKHEFEQVALNLDIFSPIRPGYAHLVAHQADGAAKETER